MKRQTLQPDVYVKLKNQYFVKAHILCGDYNKKHLTLSDNM